MPVDRVIILKIEEEGHRNEYGEFVPGRSESHRIWATRRDLSLRDITEVGGELTNTRREWRVRWLKTLADVRDLTTVSIEDEGVEFNVDNLVEVTGRDGITRRRFYDIEGVHST